MKTIEQLKQELGALYDEARAIIEKCDVEKRTITTEEETRYDVILTQMDALKADIAKRERLEGFKGVEKPQGSQRNGQFANGRDTGEGFTATPDTEKGIYFRYLRTGDQGAEKELRAYNNSTISVGTSTDAGVTVPTGFVQDIKARRDEMYFGPKLGLTNVPGKGTTVDYPIDNEDDVLFTSLAEAGTILQDAPALTKKSFTLVKYTKFATLTWEILRDEDAHLEAFLTNWIARGWAATLNKALITEVLANGTAGLTLASATAIAATEIPALVGKVLPEYQDGSQWIMHPTTFAYISGIASSSIFTFSQQPGGNMQKAPGNNLWGYPVNQSSYATAYAASVKSLMFGNFNYLGFREATEMTTIRDPYTALATGNVRLWYWFDAVFGVLQAEAIQYATHPSA